MGEMIAVLKSSENTPAFIDALNMAVNVGAITSAASFRSLPDILSYGLLTWMFLLSKAI
jgi:hypothetical protein